MLTQHLPSRIALPAAAHHTDPSALGAEGRTSRPSRSSCCLGSQEAPWEAGQWGHSGGKGQERAPRSEARAPRLPAAPSENWLSPAGTGHSNCAPHVPLRPSARAGCRWLWQQQPISRQGNDPCGRWRHVAAHLGAGHTAGHTPAVTIPPHTAAAQHSSCALPALLHGPGPALSGQGSAGQRGAAPGGLLPPPLRQGLSCAVGKPHLECCSS